MINPKQRAFLKSLSHSMEPIMNIGKYGVNDETIRQLDLALEKRELIWIPLQTTRSQPTIVKRRDERRRSTAGRR